jgi:transcriptional regulator with XRE-family HTH domain/cytoskeletal protein CcmA (bactofilin family)
MLTKKGANTMLDNYRVGNQISLLRREKGLTGEKFAEALGVTPQAVSKWENGKCLPETALLPLISKLLEASIDFILTGEERKTSNANGTGNARGTSNSIGSSNNSTADTLKIPQNYSWEDDDVIRLVLFRGWNLLEASENTNHLFRLNGDVKDLECKYNLTLEGEVKGNVNAGDCVNCGNIGGNLTAGDCVSCGNIEGNLSAGDSVNCGNVGGGVNAGDAVNCGNIGGGVNAGDGINCANIGGSVHVGDDLYCHDISGAVTCEGDIECVLIKGNVDCKGDIIYKEK